MIIGCIFSFLAFHLECYNLAKCVFLRKNADIYIDELVKPITFLLKAAYAVKMVASVLVYIYIDGSTHTETSDLSIIVSLGIQEGVSLYGPILAQLLAVVLLGIIH